MLLAPRIDKLDFNQDRYSKTLVIIDPNVANPQQLAAGVVLGAAVKILDAEGDHITQITEILPEYPNLETLHLVSHGSPGCIHLGNSPLNLDTLPEYAAEISTWFSSSNPSAPLSEGVSFRTASSSPQSPRLLIYGCNVAQGDAGREFINKLQQLTHSQIKASSTKVGNNELGGNWQLDIAVGEDNTFSSSSIAFNLATQKNMLISLPSPLLMMIR